MTDTETEVCQACCGLGYFKRYQIGNETWEQTCGVCGGAGRV